jgi:hypothetical protein
MAWFHPFLALQTAAVLLFVCTDVRLDIPMCSLFAPEGRDIALATEAEMRQHTFTSCDKLGKSRKRIRRSFHWGPQCSKDFHGFILFNNHDAHNAGRDPQFIKEGEQEEWTDIFHKRLPELLRTKAYRNAFHPIFARVNGTVDERRGDSKRQQIRLKRVLKIAHARYERAQSDMQKAQTRKDLELVQNAKRLLATHYSRLVQVRDFLPTSCLHALL